MALRASIRCIDGYKHPAYDGARSRSREGEWKKSHSARTTVMVRSDAAGLCIRNRSILRREGWCSLIVLGYSGHDNSVAFKKRAFPGLSARDYLIVSGHDSAAALVTPRGIVAAAAEERFNRQKKTGAFPVEAVRYCLEAGGVRLEDIDYIAHGHNYEPYRESYERLGTLRRDQFREVFSREAQEAHLRTYLDSVDLTEKLVEVPHHLAHAASAYYLSGWSESLILVTDGMGESHSSTVAVGRGGRIEILREIAALHSLGIFYGVLTLHLGFRMTMDEYKVMGLAPYGDARRFYDDFMSLIHLHDDGSHSIPILFANETELEKETFSKSMCRLAEVFGPAREPEGPIEQVHKDLAAGLQLALQTALLHILRIYKKETGLDHLCMAGGVALNCTANSVIKRSRLFKNIFVQPASSDDGTALGAALYVQRTHDSGAGCSRMGLPLWGPEPRTELIREALEARDDITYEEYESHDQLCTITAKALADGEILGWFHGRMEYGPRALGNRSILADPRDPTMRDKVNHVVKKREGFRPFAPAVTEEAASVYFDVARGDEAQFAYMLFTAQTRREFVDLLPAVTHVDRSARVQTVSAQWNPRFHALLKAFEAVTGVPVLLNTSFNLRGEPIVCRPEDALKTLFTASLDGLVIDRFFVRQNRQSAR